MAAGIERSSGLAFRLRRSRTVGISVSSCPAPEAGYRIPEMSEKRHVIHREKTALGKRLCPAPKLGGGDRAHEGHSDENDKDSTA